MKSKAIAEKWEKMSLFRFLQAVMENSRHSYVKKKKVEWRTGSGYVKGGSPVRNPLVAANITMMYERWLASRKVA